MSSFDILFNLIESMIYASFVFIIFKKRKGYFTFIITVFSYFCCLNFFNYFYFLPQLLLNIFTILIIFLYACFINKKQYIQNLFIALLIDCIHNIAVTITVILTSSLYGFPFYTGYGYIFAVIISKILFIIISLIVSKYITTYQLLKSKKLKSILFSVLIILLMYSTITDFIYFKEALDNYITVVLLLLNILSIFICIIFVESQKEQIEKLSLQKDKLRLETQEKIYELNQETILEMRKWKHDMKHVFLSLNHYLKHNEISDAFSLIEQQNGILNQNSIYIQSGNELLDTILIEKNKIIKDNNINLVIKCDPCTFPLDHSLFFIIVGNLFDNAIESCLSTKQSQINVSTGIQQQYYFIKIQNTINHPILKNNPHLKTTKEDNLGHGFGIKNIKRILVHYHGMINFDDSNNIFTAKVIIPMDQSNEE